MKTVEGLTPEQQAVNYETMRHIEKVRNNLNLFAIELLKRGEKHDQSKLKSPEVELFAEYTDKLADCEYNSDEYKEYLKQLAPALTHHYANNSHHPQFYKDGINDMDLIDLIEMFVDWKAASERHNSGNLNKSIEINAERFSMSPQLVKIFENSVRLFR